MTEYNLIPPERPEPEPEKSLEERAAESRERAYSVLYMVLDLSDALDDFYDGTIDHDEFQRHTWSLALNAFSLGDEYIAHCISQVFRVASDYAQLVAHVKAKFGEDYFDREEEDLDDW